MSKELEALHTIAFNTQFIAGMNFGNELRTIEQALQRLEAIDKFKEELGCPVDVFFKALTNGVYVIDEETKELQCILRGLYIFTDEGLGTSAGFSDERVWRRKVNKAGTEFNPIYFWKDYKKTWWIKKDMSE